MAFSFNSGSMAVYLMWQFTQLSFQNLFSNNNISLNKQLIQIIFLFSSFSINCMNSKWNKKKCIFQAMYSISVYVLGRGGIRTKFVRTKWFIQDFVQVRTYIFLCTIVFVRTVQYSNNLLYGVNSVRMNLKLQYYL